MQSTQDKTHKQQEEVMNVQRKGIIIPTGFHHRGR